MADRSKAWRNMPFRFVFAALAVVGVALARADPMSTAPGETGPVEIKIVSTEFKFAPAKIRVTAGGAATLVLDNSDAETEHGIVVPAFGFRLQAKAGEVVRKTFVFSRPGKYEFICDLPAHREAGMKGTLIVGAF
jgi:plastocyanin